MLFHESYQHTLEQVGNRIVLALTRESINQYYLDECNQWLNSEQSNPPPHPYKLLDMVTQELAQVINGSWRLSRISANDRSRLNNYPYTSSQAFCNSEDIQGHHHVSYQIETHAVGELSLLGRGGFFEPHFLHWNTQVLEYRFRKLATKEIHELNFSNFGLNTDDAALHEAMSQLKASCNCDPRHFFFNTGDYSSYLCYICPICGKKYFCECFSPMKEAWINIRRRLRHQYFEYDDTTPYRSEICHMCMNRIPPPVFIHKMYGSFIMQRYTPWIFKEVYLRFNKLGYMKRNSSELREAENIIREKLGVYRIGEKWVSETALYKLIRALCGDRFEVIHHARPKFLVTLEYDVYIPEIKLAFEYDGVQHERAVEFFGGEDAHKKTRERDKQKDRLSRENDIKLVRIKDNVTDQKIADIITEQEDLILE